MIVTARFITYQVQYVTATDHIEGYKTTPGYYLQSTCKLKEYTILSDTGDDSRCPRTQMLTMHAPFTTAE